MKAILEFNLPDDQEEYNLASNGHKYWQVLWDFDQILRSNLKFGELSRQKEKIYQEIRDSLYRTLDQHEVTL